MTATPVYLNIKVVRFFTGLIVAFSLVTSASFSGIDIESIVTFVHILEHDHGNHGHHELSMVHKENSKKRGFKITHQHENDSHDEGEPHQHTVNLGPSMICLYKEPLMVSWHSPEPRKHVPTYIQNRGPSPDLDGLYRPPKS